MDAGYINGNDYEACIEPRKEADYAVAWSAVKKSYKKEGGEWQKKNAA